LPAPGGMDSLPADLTGPNVACVYDVLVGGADDFAADRAEAERLLGVCPGLRGVVRKNRAFLGRAVAWAASQGVTQFADLGVGLPMPRRARAAEMLPEVHQAAQEVTRRRAWRTSITTASSWRTSGRSGRRQSVAVADADLTDPASVLAHRDVRAVIDMAQPVCVVMGPGTHACRGTWAQWRSSATRGPGACAGIAGSRSPSPMYQWGSVGARTCALGELVGAVRRPLSRGLERTGLCDYPVNLLCHFSRSYEPSPLLCLFPRGLCHVPILRMVRGPQAGAWSRREPRAFRDVGDAGLAAPPWAPPARRACLS
jgi:hypothetical protein